MGDVASADATTSAQVRAAEVLVVGRANTCRSVAAELLLRDALAPHGEVVVTSAGVEPDPEPTIATLLVPLLNEVGLPTTSHVPQRVTREMVERAALVLTVTRAERSVVVGSVPSAVRRTFTLLELARLVAAGGLPPLPEGPVGVRLEALAAAASIHRVPTAPRPAEDDDLEEPRSTSPKAHALMIAQVQAAVETVAMVVKAPGPRHRGTASELVFGYPQVPRRRRRRRIGWVAVSALVALAALATALSMRGLVLVADPGSQGDAPSALVPSEPVTVLPVDGAATQAP